LGKITEKVQTRGGKHVASLFHFSLIKLLVLKELEKRGSAWEDFLAASNFINQTDMSKIQEQNPAPETSQDTSGKDDSIEEPIGQRITTRSQASKRKASELQREKRAAVFEKIKVPQRLGRRGTTKELVEEVIPKQDINSSERTLTQ